MQLNLKKIDERIQRLQEVRRIAADPELVAMLFEFIAAEDEQTAPAPPPAAKPATIFAASADDSAIVDQVVNGMNSQGSGGLWSRKKA